MPGEYQPARPWLSWSIEQWQAYRADIVHGIERLGDPWATNIGRSCLQMADAHLARLTGG